jgi:hypothetical protein
MRGNEERRASWIAPAAKSLADKVQLGIAEEALLEPCDLTAQLAVDLSLGGAVLVG